MKKLVLLLLMIFALVSCNEGLENSLNASIRAFIEEHYNGARILSAEYDDKGLFEVEIRHKSVVKDVYFDYKNEWVYTSWEVRPADVLDVVRGVIAEKYPGYRIDSADYIQRSSGDYYVLELEKGDFEANVTITVDGEIISPSTIMPVLSADIKEFISNKYPSATIVDYGYDVSGIFEVIIRDGNIEKYLFFDSEGAWNCTRWFVSVDYLPNAVNSALAASYPSYFVESAYFVETPDAVFYEIELKLGEKEIVVKVTPDGAMQA